MTILGFVVLEALVGRWQAKEEQDKEMLEMEKGEEGARRDQWQNPGACGGEDRVGMCGRLRRMIDVL